MSGDSSVAAGVAERLAPYEIMTADQTALAGASTSDTAHEDVVGRAATLLMIMPRNQRRETIARLVSPEDPEVGRRAVDALIDAAFATEDDAGYLRRLG